MTQQSPICQDQCGLGRWRNECLSITGAFRKFQGRDDQIAEVLLVRIILSYGKLTLVRIQNSSNQNSVAQLFLRVMKNKYSLFFVWQCIHASFTLEHAFLHCVCCVITVVG
jgi:hypothetical protein